MKKLKSLVENEIHELLCERFAIIFDGRTSGSIHYVGLFATFPCTVEGGYQNVLLGLPVMGDELSQGADEHYDLIEFVLSLFGKEKSKVVAFVGDNSNTKRALERLFGSVSVGYHFHCFVLAVKHGIQEHEDVVNRVNS